MQRDFYDGCTYITLSEPMQESANTKVASFKPVYYCSSPGALQAKLLVQS